MVQVIVVGSYAESRVLVLELQDLLFQALVFATHGLELVFESGDLGLEFFDMPLFPLSEGALSAGCIISPSNFHLELPITARCESTYAVRFCDLLRL